jgi:hypothetical protein
LKTILDLQVPSIDSLFRRGDIRFFKQCPQHSSQITTFLFSILHATSANQVFSLATDSGTPFRERITWFLLFQLFLTSIPSKELALWSALTASESQSSLTEAITEQLLYKLWGTRMTEFLNKGATKK